MKKIALLALSGLLFAGISYSQNNASSSNGNDNITCSSHVIKYSGPHNSNQLEKILNESQNDALLKLDVATKTSLVNNIVFTSGLPTGMLGMDENIKKLYSSPSFAGAVFSAIFGCEVIICTSDTRPIVEDISIADFNKLTAGGTVFRSAISECTNCWALNGGSGSYGACCQVGGNGCFDEIAVVGNHYYHVK